MSFTDQAAGTAELIRRRRTIKPKAMKADPVDQQIIDQMLEAANWAPTHGMTQPWRFTVFTESARDSLGEFLARTYKQIASPEQFKQKKYESFLENPSRVGAVIVVGMKRQETQKISELDELLAVACAVQNMHLIATANGLGGFWSTNIAAVSDEMRDHIGLGENDRALGLFYVGHPAVAEWPEGQREPITERVTWRR